MRTLIASLLMVLAGAADATAEPAIRLKTREIHGARSAELRFIDSPARGGRGHLILQFAQPPDAAITAALQARGITVLADIPEHGLLVSLNARVYVIGLGVHYAEGIAAADKISPLVGSAADTTGFYLAEFHPDINLNEARGIALGSGLLVRDNPDLSPHQLLVNGALASLATLAGYDGTAYIFPASADLVNAVPVAPCGGPLTTNGPLGQYVATNGYAWGGSTHSALTLNYVFSSVTEKLPAAATQTAIQNAMAEWMKVIALTWQPSTSSAGNRTVNILFASGPHGDGYPFDGRGGILAHTFYPAPPNPEPIAGDMHFDDAESWHSGVNTDVFSVALHELGHALGLGHSDNPADVMYPYYKIVSTLAPGDRTAILALYAAAQSAPPIGPINPSPPPTPPPPPTVPSGGSKDTTAPTLQITSPSASSVSTSLPAITISGTASDNLGVAYVKWSTNMGYVGAANGTSNWTASVPLVIGSNSITITAADAAGNTSWRSVAVSRH